MATPVTTETPILERLADTGMTVADPREDIRGRTVVDPNGTRLGAVDALFVDVPRRHVRLVRVASGGVFGFGQTKVLVPVEVITHVTPERVVVDSTRQRFAGAVRYDPELAETADAPDVYQHYGFAPFWIAGYVPPIPQDPHRRRDPPIPPHGPSGGQLMSVMGAPRNRLAARSGVSGSNVP